jgi:hypothetical protein
VNVSNGSNANDEEVTAGYNYVKKMSARYSIINMNHTDKIKAKSKSGDLKPAKQSSNANARSINLQENNLVSNYLSPNRQNLGAKSETSYNSISSAKRSNLRPSESESSVGEQPHQKNQKSSTNENIDGVMSSENGSSQQNKSDHL